MFIFTIRVVFSVFPIFQATFSLFLLEYFVSTHKRPITEKYRVLRYLEQPKLHHAWWTTVNLKKLPASMKSSSSEEEQDQEVTFQLSLAQLIPNMFMPYIEGPQRDWTVNNGLYHRLLKWHLKCENILEYELEMLTEKRKCKKLIAWYWWFCHQLVCFLESVYWETYPWYNLRNVWRILQVPVKWNKGPVWPSHKLLARKQVDGWMV